MEDLKEDIWVGLSEGGWVNRWGIGGRDGELDEVK